jgi:DNA-binding IclR family transcriptional regulator
MTASPIPDDIRRFVLTSVPSVPYIESLLLLRREAGSTWSPGQLARRVYVPEAKAAELLQSLVASGVVETVAGAPEGYRYHPSPQLAELLDRLALHYTSNLLAITGLIHSGANRRAQQFADAFRWRKDS